MTRAVHAAPLTRTVHGGRLARLVLGLVADLLRGRAGLVDDRLSVLRDRLLRAWGAPNETGPHFEITTTVANTAQRVLAQALYVPLVTLNRLPRRHSLRGEAPTRVR